MKTSIPKIRIKEYKAKNVIPLRVTKKENSRLIREVIEYIADRDAESPIVGMVFVMINQDRIVHVHHEGISDIRPSDLFYAMEYLRSSIFQH